MKMYLAYCIGAYSGMDGGRVGGQASLRKAENERVPEGGNERVSRVSTLSFVSSGTYLQ